MSAYRERIAAGFFYAFEGERLHAETSPFQTIEILENPAFGRVLALDGLTQTTERDEFIYHEMLAHVPLLSLDDPARVLIIGGGDGGTLRRVLEHPGVERAVMVEIDGQVVEACRRFMPSIAAGALDDPRAEVIVGDGAAYVADGTERFDAILCDSSDPVGPGTVLFTPEFYANVRRRLRPGGLFAAQSGGPLFQQRELHDAWASISGSFPQARLYLAAIPTYPGTLWSFALAGERVEPDAAAAAKRAAERGVVARYWTPEVHAACFALPQVVLDVVAPDGPPRHFGPSSDELG